MNLKNGRVFTSKFVGTGPSSYEKRIYRAAVSQMLRNTVLEDHRVHIGICMGVEVRITCSIYQALLFCRTTDGRILVT